MVVGAAGWTASEKAVMTCAKLTKLLWKLTEDGRKFGQL